MARYVKESSSSKDNEDHVDLIEERKADEPEDGVDSVSSGGTQPSGGTFKCISSVDLSSQFSGSQKKLAIQWQHQFVKFI